MSRVGARSSRDVKVVTWQELDYDEHDEGKALIISNQLTLVRNGK